MPFVKLSTFFIFIINASQGIKFYYLVHVTWWKVWIPHCHLQRWMTKKLLKGSNVTPTHDKMASEGAPKNARQLKGGAWSILYIANYDTKLSVPSAPPKASCWGIPLSCLCTGYQGTIDRHGINPWRGELSVRLEVEANELWSHAGTKPNQRWRWYTQGHKCRWPRHQYDLGLCDRWRF